MLQLPDELSAAQVLSWQAAAEAGFVALLETHARQALEAISNRAQMGRIPGTELTSAFASEEWRRAVDLTIAALEIENFALREDLRTELIEAAIGTEAHSTVLEVLNENRFDAGTSLAMATKNSPAMSLALQLEISLGLTEDSLVAAGSPTDGARERLLRRGRYWRTRLSREARTAFTGLTGRMVLAELERRSRFRTTRKKWVCRHDDKVRPSHLEADGQVRELHEPFRVGDTLMMHPGQRGAPLAEAARCRCVIAEA